MMMSRKIRRIAALGAALLLGACAELRTQTASPAVAASPSSGQPLSRIAFGS